MGCRGICSHFGGTNVLTSMGSDRMRIGKGVGFSICNGKVAIGTTKDGMSINNKRVAIPSNVGCNCCALNTCRNAVGVGANVKKGAPKATSIGLGNSVFILPANAIGTTFAATGSQLRNVISGNNAIGV